jgi:hypothetical protein
MEKKKLTHRSVNNNPQIFWAHSAIANPQISEVCQSANRNFVMIISPQITNPKICNDNHQIASLQISLVS